MPLPTTIRSHLSSVPPLDYTRTPPTLTSILSCELTDLSYSQFEYDPYKDVVGRGGNAVVYRATIPSEDLEVALKQPFPNQTVEDNTIKRILGEAEHWAAVDDQPYIADVLDWGYDTIPWIATEYVSGGHLTDALDEFSLAQRLWTAYAIVDAVAYANGQKGVLHHDLKPQNILLQKSPQSEWAIPKVVDWGLSRELTQHNESISQATQSYAAPEQINSFMPNVPVGAHTDVYQLGVICYEVMTGRRPAHLRDDVPPPSDVNSDVPSVVDAPVMQALAHDRRDRFDHTVLLRKELSNVIKAVLLDKDESHATPASGTTSFTSKPEQNIEASGDSASVKPHQTKGSTAFQSAEVAGSISVVGCGGFGGNIIDHLTQDGVEQLTRIAVDTDQQSLRNVQADTSLLIGKERTNGRGTGDIPQVGEEAALESREEITDAIEGSELVFVTAGLGGGTGTGTAPVVAETARKSGVLTIAIVSTPFTAEGDARRTNAEAGIERLRDVADAVIVIPNDRLIDSIGSLSVRQAFKISDEVIVHSVKGLTELVMKSGRVNLSFADVRIVMENGGIATVGIGTSGSTVWDAVASAVHGSLLSRVNLSSVDSLLVGVRSSMPVSMKTVLDEINGHVPPDARIVYGTVPDEEQSETVHTLIFAAGLELSDIRDSENTYSRGNREDINYTEHDLLEDADYVD